MTIITINNNNEVQLNISYEEKGEEVFLCFGLISSRQLSI